MQIKLAWGVIAVSTYSIYIAGGVCNIYNLSLLIEAETALCQMERNNVM